MKGILPVGTVVRFGEMPLLIIGYRFIKTEEKTDIGYLSEIYPLGFLNEKSILCIPRGEIGAVVYYPEGADRTFSNALSQMLDVVQHLGEEKANEELNKFLTQLEQEKRGLGV